MHLARYHRWPQQPGPSRLKQLQCYSFSFRQPCILPPESRGCEHHRVFPDQLNAAPAYDRLLPPHCLSMAAEGRSLSRRTMSLRTIRRPVFSHRRLFFTGGANGVPDGTKIDAIGMDGSGNLLLSFDVTISVPKFGKGGGMLTVKPADLVRSTAQLTRWFSTAPRPASPTE